MNFEILPAIKLDYLPAIQIFELYKYELKQSFIQFFVRDQIRKLLKVNSNIYKHHKMMMKVESFGFPNENRQKIKLKNFCVVLKKIHPTKFELDQLKNMQKKPKFQCDLCGYENILKYKINYHMTGKHLGLLKCRICEKVFNFKHNLKTHMRIHENPFGYFCKFCNDRFQSYIGLEIHIEAKHFHKKGTFACDKCDKSFMLKSKLTVHKRREHSIKIKCLLERCDKLFKRRDVMKNHYNKVHLGLKRKKIFCCDLCEYKIPRKYSLKNHMTSKHLKVRPFKCNQCNFDTVYKRELDIHRESNHEPKKPSKFKCLECQNEFKAAKGLKYHMKAFHEGIDCEICDRKFINDFSLKKHIAIDHLRDKGSFQCDLCPKKFVLKIQLTVHRSQSHQERVKCKFESCDKDFSSKRSMENHYKTIHLKIKLHVSKYFFANYKNDF